MDKILILGVNGFTGSHFQKYIKNNNLLGSFKVLGIDKREEELTQIPFKKCDIEDCRILEKIIVEFSPDYIINLVGTFDLEDLEKNIKINAEISKNIFDILIKNKILIKNLLLIGSAGEYGFPKMLPVSEEAPLNPVNIYGLSKAIQTQYALFYYNCYKVNVNIARTFNIIGENMPSSLSIGSFVKKIKDVRDKDVIYVGNLDRTRDFLDINDVIDAYWRILIKGKHGEIYNVCSGKSYLIGDILKYLIKSSNKNLKVVVKDEYIRKNDVKEIYGDNFKLKKHTGWKEQGNIYSVLSRILAKQGFNGNNT